MTKPAVFALCLVPMLWGIWAVWKQEAGPNPVEYITHLTGTWTLQFLLITLAITPLRQLLRRPGLIRYRRMLGLFAFFYGSLHLMTYLSLDQFFDWGEIWKDIYKRPFITAGFAAFVMMIPLAITSTKGWVRRLGGKRWQWLHRLIYGSALGGVIHYYWLVKSDIRSPLMYAACMAALLGYRIWKRSFY